jgi:DNA replication and repair protein RecF
VPAPAGPAVMSLVELAVEDLRCLQRAELTLPPRSALIWGPNGAGKTSLLEAIFLLGRGRSFRTRTSERLIRRGAERLTVFGRLDDSMQTRLGVAVSAKDGTSARIRGADTASLVELSEAFPVQVIEPGVHKLIEEGPPRRRRWIDWAVFHVEHGYGETWSRYARALRQRNAALKSSSPAQAEHWDGEVARLGELLAEARARILSATLPFWNPLVQELSGLEVSLQHSRGWAEGSTLAESLVASAERDRLRGTTHAGPHRGDIVVRVAGRPARDVLSRGQQKLVAIAMLIAQLEMLRDATGVAPTLLLDDPAAELDRQRLECFIERVNRLPGQLIQTALAPDNGLFGKPERVFHVEQGRVEPV